MNDSVKTVRSVQLMVWLFGALYINWKLYAADWLNMWGIGRGVLNVEPENFVIAENIDIEMCFL